MSGQVAYRLKLAAQFEPGQLMKGAASQDCNRAAFALRNADRRGTTIYVLEAGDSGFLTRRWVEGRRCGALAVSPSGERIVAEVDGTLWLGPPGDAAPGPTLDGVSAIAWLNEKRFALVQPAEWPPIRIFDSAGNGVGQLEPNLPPASQHQPALATSKSGHLAFCYSWTDIAVFELERGDATQVTLSADVSGGAVEAAPALQVWLSSAGDEVAAAPWPDPQELRPLMVWGGEVGAGMLRPRYQLPSAAAVAVTSDLRVIYAAPMAHAGSIEVFEGNSQGSEVAKIPSRVWGIRVATDLRRMLIWAERSAFLLERDI